MRPGEALVLAGLAVTGPLILLRLSTIARRWTVAGWTLAWIVLSGVEGVRWQLVPAIFVTLLLALPPPRRGRIALAVASLLPIALSAYLAHALPVFTLPKPNGPHAVGVAYTSLVDLKRPEPFVAPPDGNRAVAIKAYYPAVPDTNRPTLAYFRGSRAHLQAFARFYGMPPFAFDHLALVRTHATEGLTPIDSLSKLPVVLFSHGAGTGMETETALCEDLASRGFVVVAVDHPYVSAATALDGRIIDARAANVDFAIPEPAEAITEIMADDLRFVLDALARGEGVAALNGRLQTDAVAATGHSVGGAAAYRLALTDRRVRCVVNLDGVVYAAPPPGKRVPPTLMLANDRYHVAAVAEGRSLAESEPPGDANRQAYVARAKRNAVALRDVLRESNGLYTIVGSDHMKFTDLGLYIGDRKLREGMGIGGATEPARCLEIAGALTAAFLDRHLRGAREDVRYPELRQVPLTASSRRPSTAAPGSAHR